MGDCAHSPVIPINTYKNVCFSDARSLRPVKPKPWCQRETEVEGIQTHAVCWQDIRIQLYFHCIQIRSWSVSVPSAQAMNPAVSSPTVD